MKRNKISIVFILLLSITFSSCIQQTPEIEPSGTSDTQVISVVGDTENITIEDIKNPKVIEEEKYYKVLQGENHNYYYYIYDINNVIVSEGGYYWRCPKISMINDNLVKVRTQSGTGVSTSSTFYYDVKKNEVSCKFHSVYDETEDLLIFSEDKKIIVRDIFDKSLYYFEFTEFDNDLADAIEPFVDVKFININQQIEVTYLIGEDLRETTDIIDLV